MIVDDHEGMRQMLKNFLAISFSGPFEVIECENGDEAVQEYALHHPDCVLMDIELHLMDGFKAAQIIIQHDEHANIIIVTAYDTISLRRKARQLNLAGFVVKDRLTELIPILKTISIK